MFYLNRNSIYVSVRFNGKRKQLSTGIVINPDHWNAQKKRVNLIYGHEEPNARINANLSRIERLYKNCPTYNHFQKAIKDGTTDFIALLDQLIENYHSNSMKRNFKSVKISIQKFNEWSPGDKIVDPSDINMRTYDLWIKFGQANYYSVNTVANKWNLILQAHKYGSDYGLWPKISYQFPKLPRYKKKNVVLTEEEIMAIANVQIESIKIQKVRFMFIYQCWTGLRFSDLLKVLNRHSALLPNYSALYPNDTFSFIQKKTRKRVVVPVSTQLKDWILKHRSLENFKMPISTYNYRLKKVGRLAALDQMLTDTKLVGSQLMEVVKPKYEFISSHTARRSFATINYQKGVPAALLMQITGHKSESSFYRYISMDEENAAEKLRSYWK